VRVTGFVEDVGAHLRHARVSVVPLRAGSGQLLKVLEALASGTAVVSTSTALGGIAAEPGRQVLVADDAASFATHVTSLLRDDALAGRLGALGRKLVEERYTWDHSASGLEAAWRAALERASRRE
jgi:polysaccharide biosynthesis protein PslH